MTKLHKKITKATKKDPRVVVLLGYDQKNMDQLIESFKTIFFVDIWNDVPRLKNIIKIEDLSFFQNIDSVDVIIINSRYDENILKFIPLLTKKSTPAILLNQDLTANNDYFLFLSKIKYEMLDIISDYQLWKVVRK